MQNYEVTISYPSEVIHVYAKNKENAEEKALKQIGIINIDVEEVCEANAIELNKDEEMNFFKIKRRVFL